jgi:hypothetical protein
MSEAFRRSGQMAYERHSLYKNTVTYQNPTKYFTFFCFLAICTKICHCFYANQPKEKAQLKKPGFELVMMHPLQ